MIINVDSPTDERAMPRTSKNMVICVCNSGYEASLELLKVYVAARGNVDDRFFGQIRITDESGGDYLYPERSFVSVDLAPSAVRAILRAMATGGQGSRR